MTGQPAEGERDRLTQGEAEGRAARISNVAYDLALDLTRGAADYRGSLALTFEVVGEGDTFLDFRGKTIHQLTVNGVALAPQWTGYRLVLPGASLGPQTKAEIVYQNDYDHDGDGFHQFVDPEDGEEYLYSNFEPYSAHRLFPCFDQPDIKAVYSLSVTAPAEWAVIGNSRIASTSAADDGRSRHVFEQSARFSTYLFALVAGPYQAFRDEHAGVPLGLYCRQSLVKYLDTDELFTVTKQGLDFYAEFFDWPYPFTKYDQIFVPEFNAGAMENVGCVTHYERLIFRDPPTESQRLNRAEVVLHEMAHMWFGNLVTMRWWNNLWLNETFATYMSYLAMTSATRFTTAWQAFNSDMKARGYRQDQLVTTHPVAGEVPDTDATFLNFDGITYGKGAAAIQQLVAAIGLEGFREGMRRYFKRHAYANTTLPEFLAALEEGSGRELQQWAALWLETPSLNTLTAAWQSDSERLSDLRIGQSAEAAYPTLRPHHVEVALLHDDGATVTIEAIAADLSGAETELPAARGRRKPALVFPNYNDLTFAKVALDPESLAYVRGSLERVTEPLLRQLLWAALWEMVRDRHLKSTDYLTLVREKVVSEPNLELMETTLGHALGALDSYIPDGRREEQAHALFETARVALEQANGGDAAIIWARTLVSAARSPEDLAYAARLADEQEPAGSASIDQEMRWALATRWVARGIAGGTERVAAEGQRDPSDRGQRAMLRAETARPDAATKDAAWQRILGDGYGSLHLTAAAMSGFNSAWQRDLLQPYIARFFAEVPAIFRERPHEAAATFFRSLFPFYRAEPETLAQSERLLGDVGAELPVVGRMLREANDDLSRMIAVRAFAEA